ncbi:MAG: hypothetical protein ACK502_08700 [Alphaproteobacteria bacterium]
MPVIFQKFVDRQVENRGRLLLGYQEILDGAKQGRPVRGEDLDRLQEEYMDEYRKQQKEISSFFTAASYISDISQPKEEQPYGGMWSWSEPDEKKSQEKNQPVAGKEGRQKSEHFPGQPDGDKSKSENKEMAPESQFKNKYRKMLQFADNIDAAHKYKIEQWNEEHEDKLKGLDIDAINSALLKQSRKSGEIPRENIQLDPETKNTPELFKDLLSKNPGIAIADVHIFDDSFAMVDKHMATLKQAGVDTIYIEADPDWVKKVVSFSPEDIQKLQAEGKRGDISIRTAQQNAWNYKMHTSEDFFAGMLNMIKSAKEHGIAVKGMDEYPMAEVK